MTANNLFAHPAMTPIDPTDMLAWLAREGVVLQSRGSVFGEQVYLCLRGRRHPIVSATRLNELGFRWPIDVQPVSEKMLASYAPAGGVPKPWWNAIDTAAIDTAAIGDAMAVREALACGLSGFGLEIGAGASPFPVSPLCRVLYGDRLPYEKLVAAPYPGQRPCDIVIPDVLTDFDTLENIADGSLDFLVACHVIEHTRNPIGSIAAAWRKLKPGGRLVLVVPDKERTFDRARPVTTLEHLVEDHRNPRRDRDLAHYEEFCMLAAYRADARRNITNASNGSSAATVAASCSSFLIPSGNRLAQPVSQNHLADTIRQKFAECYAIHYHVWTHDSFAQMLTHVVCEVCPWSHVWTHPAVAERPQCIEFYALLVK